MAPAGVSLSLSLRLSVACCTAYLAHFFFIFWPTAAAHLAHIRNELRNDFRYLLLRTGKLKKNWIWQNVWPTSSRVESSRVASIGVKKMKNNCTALARQLPDFYGKQLFFFISHPLHSLSFAKFISHFHFVCHCRLAGFSSSITQRETAKERLKKTRLPKRVTVVISISSSSTPSQSLSLKLTVFLTLFASCFVELKLVARGAGCSLVDWKMFNQLLLQEKNWNRTISSCVFSDSVVNPPT